MPNDGSSYHIAEIAQLVEHNLAKVGVASSSLVFRSKNPKSQFLLRLFFVVILSLIAPPSTCGKVVLYQLAVIEVSQQVMDLQYLSIYLHYGCCSLKKQCKKPLN